MRALAVWDGQPGGGGGTASAIARWRSCGQAVTAIDPQTQRSQEYGPLADALTPSDQWLTSAPDARPEDKRALVSLLFADAVGFSKLGEEQIPPFANHFLGAIAGLLDRSKRPPIVRNYLGRCAVLRLQRHPLRRGCWRLRSPN